MTWFFVFCVFLQGVFPVLTGLFPETTSGSLKGNSIDTEYGKVTQYLGVRYAAPPVETRRFMAPLEYTRDLKDVVQATSHGAACTQLPHITELMYPHFIKFVKTTQISEDCLFLNIFVPETDGISSRRNKPVMIWVPGEGYSFGDASQFDGTWLALRGDVIVVTLNYRVGVFGFLSTGDETAPGNAGILDVVQALKWIKKNIPAFGGDPENMTLFGRFTGAMSVSILLASQEIREKGKPLFQHAILQSGVASGKYIFDDNPINATRLLANMTGCNKKQTKEMVECLRNLTSDELLQKSFKVPQMWRPVLDGYLLMGDPMDIVKKDPPNKDIDLIIGENNDDGSICILIHFYYDTLYHTKIVNDNLSKAEFQSLVKDHLHSYLKTSDPSVTETAVHEYHYSLPSKTSYRDQYINFCGFMYTKAKGEQFARYLSSHGTNVYRYQFNHRPSVSHHEEFLRAAHGDEVLFVFALLEEPGANIPEEEIQLVDRIVKAWTNFAATGTPNSPDQENDIWPKFTENTYNYMKFSTDRTDPVGTTKTMDRDVHFWSHVVPNLIRNTERTVSEGRTSATRECLEQLQDIFLFVRAFDWPNAQYLFICLIITTFILLVTVFFFLFYFCRMARRGVMEVYHQPK